MKGHDNFWTNRAVQGIVEMMLDRLAVAGVNTVSLMMYKTIVDTYVSKFGNDELAMFVYDHMERP